MNLPDPTLTRIDHTPEANGPFRIDALVVKKRGGGERIIKVNNWWINRNTPVGEPAEWWERMPHSGRRIIDPKKVVAYLRPIRPD